MNLTEALIGCLSIRLFMGSEEAEGPWLVHETLETLEALEGADARNEALASQQRAPTGGGQRSAHSSQSAAHEVHSCPHSGLGEAVADEQPSTSHRPPTPHVLSCSHLLHMPAS